MKRSLQIILAIAVVGLAFSGFLTSRELFASGPAETCPAVGQPGTILGYPPCVYGFVMYLGIVLVAAGGLLAGRRNRKRETARSSSASMQPLSRFAR